MRPILKEDAVTIADTKKELNIQKRALKLTAESFASIRRETNKAKKKVEMSTGQLKDNKEVISEVAKVLKEAGYTIAINKSGRNMRFYIYWRELTKEEKVNQIEI
jgi:ATP-dependent 26S proteasome regulatory subunit